MAPFVELSLRIWLLFLLSAVVCGWLGNWFAKKTARNAVLWTLGGAVLNIFVVVFILLAGPRKPIVRKPIV